MSRTTKAIEAKMDALTADVQRACAGMERAARDGLVVMHDLHWKDAQHAIDQMDAYLRLALGEHRRKEKRVIQAAAFTAFLSAAFGTWAFTRGAVWPTVVCAVCFAVNATCVALLLYSRKKLERASRVR